MGNCWFKVGRVEKVKKLEEDLESGERSGKEVFWENVHLIGSNWCYLGWFGEFGRLGMR